MANANRPSGLSPVRYLNGAPWTGGGRVYCIPTTDSTNAYAIGDPVKLAGSSDSAGVPTITLGTAGATACGAIVSMGGTKYGAGYYDPTNLNTTIIPATKAQNYYVLVADDPNIIFRIQEIGTGTQFAAADVSLNCDFIAGTNNGYVSGFLANNVGENTTSTLNLKLLMLSQIADNAFGAYAKWDVLLNNHSYRTGVTGV